MSTSDKPLKRKRLTQACELCRRKKIKCDGYKPSCENCLKLNNECKYSTNNKKRGPRQGYIEILEQRLAKMEKILLSPEETKKPAETVTEEEHSNDSSSAPVSASYRSEYPPSAIFSHPEQEKSPQSFTSVSTHSDPVDGLPSKDIINHVIDLYFTNLFYTLPILDEVTLRTSVREGKCSDFLLLSLLGACARFSDRPEIKDNPAWLAGEKYAEKARSMLMAAVDEPSISNLQGIVFLCMHEYGCGRGARSWMYGGIAIRMALELGLHEDTQEEQNGPPEERLFMQEMNRRLFWSIFCIDKFSSAATGKPSYLNESFCTAFLPSALDSYNTKQHYTETLTGNRYLVLNDDDLRHSQLMGINDKDLIHKLNGNHHIPPLMPHAHLSYFAYIVKAANLLGKVTSFVNQKKKNCPEELPPFHPESEFSRLDKMIEEFANQLPDHLKNTPEKFEINMNKTGPRTHRLFLLIHALYNTIKVLLHRPSLIIADTLDSNVIQPELKDFISKSVETCMTAVDNMTLLIKAIGDQKELMPPFLTYLAYTVATVVVSSSFSTREDEAQRAKQALGAYFQLLLTARNYWAMADKLYFMVRDLYAIHCNVLRRQTNPNELGKSNMNIYEGQPPPPPPPPIQNMHSYVLQNTENNFPRSFRTSYAEDPSSNWNLPYHTTGNTHNIVNSTSQLYTNTILGIQTPYEQGNSLFQMPAGYDQPLMYSPNINPSPKNHIKMNHP